jgi:hypothetical protein
MGIIIIKKKDVPATAMLHDVILKAKKMNKLREYYTHAYVRYDEKSEYHELFFTDGARLIRIMLRPRCAEDSIEPGFYQVLSAKKTEIIFEQLDGDFDYPDVDKIMHGLTSDWEACKQDNFLNDHGDYAAIIRAFKENIIKPDYILPFTGDCLKWYVHKDDAPMRITISGGHECYIMPMSGR